MSEIESPARTPSSQIIANRFEIADPERDLLGRGGMGDGYRGTDTHTGAGDIHYHAPLPPPLPPYAPPPPPDPDTLPDPGPLPPGSRLPFHRNHLSTGRAASLKTLARALLHDSSLSTLVTQAVQGVGGIGKTQLAVEFAYRYSCIFCLVVGIRTA